MMYLLHHQLRRTGQLQVIRSVFGQCSKYFGYVRGSDTKIQEFTTAYAHFDLPLKILPTDISMRWNATYLMLEAWLLYKEVVDAVHNSSRSTLGVLTEVDWQIYKCFYYFLMVFYDATVCLSGIYYPTSHHAMHKLYEISNQFEMHRKAPIF